MIFDGIIAILARPTPKFPKRGNSGKIVSNSQKSYTNTYFLKNEMYITIFGVAESK